MITTPVNSSLSYSYNFFSGSVKHLFFCSGFGVVTASIFARPEVLSHHLLVSISPIHKIGGKESALGNVSISEGTSTNSIHAR